MSYRIEAATKEEWAERALSGEKKLAELIMQSLSDLGQAQDAYQAQLLAEKKLADLNDNIKELFSLLDATEETDEGRVHRPVQIVCVRSDMLIKLENVLATLKSTMEDKG